MSKVVYNTPGGLVERRMESPMLALLPGFGERTYTLGDVHERLQAADPGYVAPRSSTQTKLLRLVEAEVIVRAGYGVYRTNPDYLAGRPIVPARFADSMSARARIEDGATASEVLDDSRKYVLTGGTLRALMGLANSFPNSGAASVLRWLDVVRQQLPLEIGPDFQLMVAAAKEQTATDAPSGSNDFIVSYEALRALFQCLLRLQLVMPDAPEYAPARDEVTRMSNPLLKTMVPAWARSWEDEQRAKPLPAEGAPE